MAFTFNKEAFDQAWDRLERMGCRCVSDGYSKEEDSSSPFFRRKFECENGSKGVLDGLGYIIYEKWVPDWTRQIPESSEPVNGDMRIHIEKEDSNVYALIIDAESFEVATPIINYLNKTFTSIEIDVVIKKNQGDS